jgi:DNA polymerase III delta subunit
MNIILLYGENAPLLQLRLDRYLEHAKKKNWQIDFFNSDFKGSLAEFLSSGNLFAHERIFIVEEGQNISQKDIDWIGKNNDQLSGYLIIVAQGRPSAKLLKGLPKKTKLEEFKLPKLIFSFLDSFYPGNCRKTLTLLKEIEKNEPVEFVFSLLAKHLRDLYWVSLNENPMPYPEAWRIAKLKAQAKKFDDETLKKNIAVLSEIDIMAKTSQGELGELLDQLILTCLE